MALTDGEVMRIRAELGYNVMAASAEPYIGVTAIFNGVIQAYTTSGAITTSTSVVTAATAGAAQSLVLASAVGFHPGDTVVVDVDARQESATVTSVVGSTITATLYLAHGPSSFPVTVEGGESMVRECLLKLRRIAIGGPGGKKSLMDAATGRAGIKAVDEIEFFGGGNNGDSAGKDPLTQLIGMREYWRDELAATLGVIRLNRRGGGGLSPH